MSCDADFDGITMNTDMTYCSSNRRNNNVADNGIVNKSYRGVGKPGLTHKVSRRNTIISPTVNSFLHFSFL